MRCDDVQEAASAWLDGELPEQLARQVAAHEAGCAVCHLYVTDLRRVSTRVARLAREPAPPGLEQHLRGLMAEERDLKPPVHLKPPVPWALFLRAWLLRVWLPWAWLPWAWLPRAWQSPWPSLGRQAAALAACSLLSILSTWAVLRLPDPAPATAHDVVAAHVRSLIQDSPIQVASSDSHTVRPWFNGRVEYAPPVKDLTAEGFQLVGGRLDYVDGHRVATLVYRRRLHTISVFIWPEHAALPAGQAVSAGLNLLSWTKDGLAWWAVSDLNADELRELRALL